MVKLFLNKQHVLSVGSEGIMCMTISWTAPFSRTYIIRVKRIFGFEDTMTANVDHFVIVYTRRVVDTESAGQFVFVH